MKFSNSYGDDGAPYFVSYAQNREDVILSAFFLDQEKGFYIDVGASDPAEFSVTKYFYDRGWSGINIEPSPRLFKLLADARPRDLNLDIGISDKNDNLTFREYEGHGLSTFSRVTMKELSDGNNPLTQSYKDYSVGVMRLDQVIENAGVKDIDFLKIDVEGYEYEVINGNDWARYRPKVLCVEANHIQRDWPAILSSNGYKKIFNDGLNDYFVDSRRGDIKFDYIKALIGRNIISPHSEMLIKENLRLRELVSGLKRTSREAEAENTFLRAHIFQQQRFKNLARSLIAKIDTIITLQLTKRIRRRKHYPNVELLSGESNAQIILAGIKAADKKAFGARQTAGELAASSFFTAIYRFYRVCKRIAFHGLKFAYRVSRRER